MDSSINIEDISVKNRKIFIRMCLLIWHRQRFETIYHLYFKKDAKGYKRHSFSKKQQDSFLLRINNTLSNSIFWLFHISINNRRISDTLKFHTNLPHWVEPLLLITPCNPGTKSIKDNTLSPLRTHSLIYAPLISLVTLELKETHS